MPQPHVDLPAEKPFRHATSDPAQARPAPFDIARFYYEQRFRIAEDAPVMRKLIAAVNWTNDLAPAQWAQWYSTAIGFGADLIVELGRGMGNSTAAFGQAAARLGRTKVVSLCQSTDWSTSVASRIAPVVEPGWFSNIDARVADILTADYADIVAGHERILVLWDAHGFEIAETVLGEILPLVADRPHLVLMHDISDNRYAGVPRSYEGQPLWKGSEWQRRTGTWGSRVNIGWMNSIQDQVIALADFSARNDLEIGSADHEYATFFHQSPDRADEMRRLLGDEFFSPIAHWAFLSLTGKPGPFHFPAVTGRRQFDHRCSVVSGDLLDLPKAILTKPRAWDYASTIAWQPAAALPADVRPWMRVQLRVEGGPVGVSLLSRDEKVFVESKLVGPGGSKSVLLTVGDPLEAGRLVIHTWGEPVAARVSLEDVSLVW
jgi:hypothetical protein